MEPLARVRNELRRHERVLVAFSGGVDSTLLLKLAVDALGGACHAITAISPTMAQSEIADARALATELGLGDRYHAVTTNELDNSNYRANPTTRCAMCKTELMTVAEPLAQRLGARVALGTVTDDLGDFRPGIAAAKDHGAVMPLVDAGLDKAAVRQLSQELGLRTWNKPQLACLSSRFPYGTEITAERLRQVDGLEDALRELGFGQVRVRYHGDVARLEIDTSEMARLADPDLRARLVQAGKRHGFVYVAMDLAGFRSGSSNEVLTQLGKRGA